MSSSVLAPARTAPPAVLNGVLRPEELPPTQPLPDDPATRDERYMRLSKWLAEWEKEPHDDEPVWDVAELFPPGRDR